MFTRVKTKRLWGLSLSGIMVILSTQTMVSCGDLFGDKEENKEGNGEEDPNGSGFVTNSTLSLNLTVANGSGSAAPSLRLAVPTDANFESTSILSGPPEEMTLYISRMVLSGTDENGQQIIFPFFDEPDGKPVKIDGSKIDLSNLFESFDCVAADGTRVTLAEGQSCKCGLAADGTVIQEEQVVDEESGETVFSCPLEDQASAPIPLVPVPTGTFTRLGVQYKGYARMKGCVDGYFRESNSKTEPGTEYTYCTKAGKSAFGVSVDAKASEFEDASGASDLIKVPFGQGGQETLADTSKFDEVNQDYSIPGGVTLGSGETADLTMLIDTNRMLRFENGGRAPSDDQPNGPAPWFSGWSGDRAYFFNSVFSNSVFVFVGKPGEIEGYEWLAVSCSPDDLQNDGNYTCPYGSETVQSFLVQGWLTIIKDPDGKPFLLNFMPDDDDTLTVIKGANITGNPSEEGFGPDASYYQTNADGSQTLKYQLDPNDVGEIDITLPTSLGSSSQGTFDGFNDSYGPIRFIRRL